VPEDKQRLLFEDRYEQTKIIASSFPEGQRFQPKGDLPAGSNEE
jgi:hypothetical protein